MVPPEVLRKVIWRTSTHSANGGGQCVEAGALIGDFVGVAIRDSKNPEAGAIAFTRAYWDAFLQDVGKRRSMRESQRDLSLTSLRNWSCDEVCSPG